MRTPDPHPPKPGSTVPTTAWEPLMNKFQVADLVGIDPQTLLTWRTRRPGFGPRAVKFDQQVSWRPSDVTWWLDVQACRLPRHTPPEVADRVLTTREAADYTGFSPSTLNTWRSRPGSNPPLVIKIGSRNGYRLADLNDWIDGFLDAPFIHPAWPLFRLSA